MERKHSMPFGAECSTRGSVRFRLWAPAAKRVDLVLWGANAGSEATERTRLLPLHPVSDGWYELVTREAGPGSRYQFQINGSVNVPDPASRFQPADVHGPSQVVDPASFDWQDQAWLGRPWQEAVIYELHVGTFTAEGTFAGVQGRLDYLKDLGITAIELMPVADFPGSRNWGYDGVLPYAPDSSYGAPDDLKRLVEAAHQRGLMVLLDVVYNHFGPDGNYLRLYSPQFFTGRHHTPWGDAINFDGPGNRHVRDFFIHNARYWLEEYNLDGLRLDAVHAIVDGSQPDILLELSVAVREAFPAKRHIHLILENDDNAARYLVKSSTGRRLFDAQWNDDIHHALHVLVTGETDGYYRDYATSPLEQLGRCLAKGFAFQGDYSEYRQRKRGESTADLPLTSFVSFLQNHDQIGNRAFGDRILESAQPEAVQAAMAILLLAPAPPLLFMGEEFGAKTPFLFFCDFSGDLALAVTEGRRSEFARFARFDSPQLRAQIPDPGAEATFQRSKLDWTVLDHPQHAEWLRFYRDLLAIRGDEIVPRLHGTNTSGSKYSVFAGTGLCVHWELASGARLILLTNLGNEAIPSPRPPRGRSIYSTHREINSPEGLSLPRWSVAWFLEA